MRTSIESDCYSFFRRDRRSCLQQIFPALYSMDASGAELKNIPIIGMARAGWTLEKTTRPAARQRAGAGTSSRSRSRNCRRC